MSSSGVGGNTMGAPLRPDYNQMEATAANQVAKQTVAIVKDSLEVPLPELLNKGEFRKGHANPDKPILPMFVHVQLARAEASEVPWLKEFKQLMEEMPAKLRAQLERQLGFPASKRDPRFKALKEGLEFAAAGLHWLRGANQNLTITDEERKKQEEEAILQHLGFFEEVRVALKKTTEALPASDRRRLPVLQLIEKLPRLINEMGKKRVRVKAGKRFSIEEDPIYKELGLLKSLFVKVDHDMPLEGVRQVLEMVEQLYVYCLPDVNQGLLNNLLRFKTIVSSKEIPTLSRLGTNVLAFAQKSSLDEERRVAIQLLLLSSFSLLTQGEKDRRDFGYQLIVGILSASSFIEKLGREWMEGLRVAKSEASLIAEGMAQVCFGYFFALCAMRGLEGKGMEELFGAIKKPWLDSTLKWMKGIDKNPRNARFQRVSLFLDKLSRVLELGDLRGCQALFNEAAVELDVDIEKMQKELEWVQGYLRLVAKELEEIEADRRKLTYSPQSA